MLGEGCPLLEEEAEGLGEGCPLLEEEAEGLVKDAHS